MGTLLDMNAHRAAFPPPAHFKKMAREIWAELVQATPPAMHVPTMRFTFEFAATLLMRFRTGRAMSVAEQKALRSNLAALGLQDDAGPIGRKPTPRKNGHYFND